jgi:adenylate cyclase class 2
VIEIEKKYRLTSAQRADVLQRLKEVGAEDRGEEFEENTIYSGNSLKRGTSVLRLRRAGARALLTYKERIANDSPVKYQREEETAVDDPSAMALILDALGFKRLLVYEKRRQTFSLGPTEVMIDELPFGMFMEIEGSEEDIDAAELTLGIRDLPAEHETYPRLTEQHGERLGDVIEARFN